MDRREAGEGAAEQGTRAATRCPPRWHLVVLMVSLAGAFFFQHRGLEDKSPTEDEWAHLTRGILYWQTGDARTSFSHPPVANAIAALPVAFDARNPDLTKSKHWTTARVGLVALGWLQDDYETARAHLITARKMMVVFLLAFVIYSYFFTASFFGRTAAVIVAVLTAFHPTLIAQARYVTTDFPAALGALVAAGELTRYLSTKKLYPIITMMLAVGFAILCKHSLLVLVVFGVVVGLCAAALGFGRFSGRKPGARIGIAFGHLALTAFVVVLCINVAYRFEQTGMTVQEILETPEPTGVVSRMSGNEVFERYTPLRSWPAGLRIPLPYTYLYGVATMRGYNHHGYPSWFWGNASRKGNVWYFPVLLMIKNPLAWVLGLGLALVAFARRRFPQPAVAAFGLIGVGFLAVAMNASLNMGVRHGLPFIAIFTPFSAWGLAQAMALKVRFAKPAVVAAVASMPLVAGFASPNFLGYFNILAGGRAGGHQVSLVGEDWGQDRAALARLVEEKALSPLYYDEQTRTRKLEAKWLGFPYEGYRCSAKRGTPATRPEDAWVAVHALRVETRGCFAWLRTRTPDYVINDHIRLYYIDDVPNEEADSAGQVETTRPDEARALQRLIERTKPPDQKGK